MDQHTQRTALKRGVERNLIYPQDPAPERCEAKGVARSASRSEAADYKVFAWLYVVTFE